VPVWGGGFLFAIISTWNSTEPFLHEWSRVTVSSVSWLLLWLIYLMIRLRNVEADDTQITINGFNGEKAVDYKDIEYVSEVLLLRPDLISIRYRDTDTGDPKNMLVMPDRRTASPFKIMEENHMTKYIRAQVIKHNPGYSPEHEPSRWKTLGFFLLTGMPSVIYSFTQMSFDRF
jgi:hypothetical protein